MNKIKGFIVTLDDDVSEEEGGKIKEIFCMVKNVIGVDPIQADVNDSITMRRIDQKVRQVFIEYTKNNKGSP